jgi:hypothetical protein
MMRTSRIGERAQRTLPGNAAPMSLRPHAAFGRAPWSGVGAVDKWPAAATAESQAAGYLSTAVVIAGPVGFWSHPSTRTKDPTMIDEDDEPSYGAGEERPPSPGARFGVRRRGIAYAWKDAGSRALRPPASGDTHSVYFPYDERSDGRFAVFLIDIIGVPYRIRTGVAAVRGRCPGPLDEGDRCLATGPLPR